MSYNPNIPVGPTKINATYNALTTNFQQLESIFKKDHYEWDYSTVASQGFHKQLTLLQLPQTGAAIPAAAASTGFVYTQQNTTGIPRTDLYYLYNSASAGNVTLPNPAPVVPFKAFGVFDNNGSIIANTSYNLASVGTAGGNTFYVNFTNALNNAGGGSGMEYVVLIAVGMTDFSQGSPVFNYWNTKNTSCNITLGNVSSGSFNRVSFGVITL